MFSAMAQNNLADAVTQFNGHRLQNNFCASGTPLPVWSRTKWQNDEGKKLAIVRKTNKAF
jgi:hypothetical protein